ncbi:MAG: DUF465 domain-containing protein [Rhizobiales bacterium]|nr:DUF465 domain-containing protein [Hyphomicrobiales bacterium]NRB14188.1 DUF465 domain-containing protein [Hyphomicrobiales bacterium]
MALEARLNELKLKHKQMETEIVSENKYPSADQSAVNGLKRAKMRLKEEISSIEAKLAS